ncbi:MAG: glycosyltransferase [Sedimentisphaerales bacterium]|jgi:glycosyltransferase involved in cell wall biosynthesis
MLDEQFTSELEPEAPKPPRVALIASRQTLAEYSSYLKHLLIGLVDDSVPAILICPPVGDVDSIVPPAVEIVRHPAIDISLMQHYNNSLLLDRIDEFRPQLLHCLCETSASLARWLARNLNVPYLLNVNSISSRRSAVTFSETRCANIIVPAGTIADHFIKAHPKVAGRLRQIDIGTFVDESTACFAHPERLPGIVISPPVDNPANLGNIFEALHRLTVDGCQFIVAIIAAGRSERLLWKQLRSMDLLHAVTIVPPSLGLYSAGSAADIFIVPRPSGSFNMLLLAAMSAGSAVVASKGGVDDLIIEDKTAFTFNPDDQLSVYNCLKRLFDRPDEARRLAADAQQFLRQNRHVSGMIASTLSLYRQAACAKPRADA